MKYLILIVFPFAYGFSQMEDLKVDSFEIQKEIIEWNYEVDYKTFSSLLIKLETFGDIHNFVLENLRDTRRTPDFHEYYPAFMSFVCNNMDSTYRDAILKMIESDALERHIVYPIVKDCLFESDLHLCSYLESQKLEDRFAKTHSAMIESLINLKNELKCSR